MALSFHRGARFPVPELFLLQVIPREFVDGVILPPNGLTRNDVHIPGEEHAARSPLAHRLDKGVLDLREVSLIKNRVLVPNDLRGLGQEEGIVAGVSVHGKEQHTVIPVGILRSLKPGAFAVSRIANLVPLLVGQLFDVVVFPIRHAEVRIHGFGEARSTDKHSDAPCIELLCESVQHRPDNGVGDVDSDLIDRIDFVNGVQNLVVDGEHHAFDDEVGHGLCSIIDKTDPIRVAIGHDHDRGNLNVVVCDPRLHELADHRNALHGRSPAHADDAAALLRHIGLVQVGEQTLPIRSRIL